MSYYSSHEGKTSIYLAKVRIDVGRMRRVSTAMRTCQFHSRHRAYARYSAGVAYLPSHSSHVARLRCGQATLDAEQTATCKKLGLDANEIAKLVDKPLYKFTEAEVDKYLKFLSATEPDLRKRIVHLARKNIGQPYELYLLGEMPFEPYDPQPIYCLGKSDCLVFTEHTYAMALSHNWPSFMKMLQRIRYRDGQLGVATRNHYTEADWNISNGWLVEDITAKLAGDTAVKFQRNNRSFEVSQEPIRPRRQHSDRKARRHLFAVRADRAGEEPIAGRRFREHRPRNREEGRSARTRSSAAARLWATSA